MEIDGVSILRHSADDGTAWEVADRTTLPAGLDRYVTRVSGYEESSPVPQRRREVPTGSISLIISFGPSVGVEVPRSASPSQLGSFVVGMQTEHALVESSYQHGIQIDLTPLGAYRLLGLPMSELAQQLVPFDAVRGPAAAELNERLATAPTWASRFAVLDSTLLRWTDEGPEPDRSVSWAWQQMKSSHGLVPISVLADEIGWSHRHFVNRFRQQVGLAPKPTGRVLRFRRAIDVLLSPAAGKTIASVAALCGYADHSHLNREFHALAGCTPSAYVAAARPDGFGIADE
jgi:AraC-like DNA-binding protein